MNFPDLLKGSPQVVRLRLTLIKALAVSHVDLQLAFGKSDRRPEEEYPYQCCLPEPCLCETVDHGYNKIRKLEAASNWITVKGGDRLPVARHDEDGQQSYPDPTQI